MFFKETYSDVYSKWPNNNNNNNNNNNASEEEYVQLKLSYSSLFLYKKIVIFHWKIRLCLISYILSLPNLIQIYSWIDQ